MSYVDQKMSNGKIGAIVIVALLHAVLGYAFITGLAYNVVKQVAKDLKTFDVSEEPPPPPPDQPVPPPPVVSPPPIVRTNTAPPPITTVRVAPPPVITPTAPVAPPAPPAPPPPPPPKVIQPVNPKANLASLFSTDDYPPSALRSGESGTTGFRLDVGADGRVTNCTVTSSSGSSALDSATCRLLTRRARFTPARDSTGATTTGVHNSRIVWRIPED